MKRPRLPRIKTSYAVLASALILVALAGLGCKGGQKVVESIPKVELSYWTVWDEPDAYAEMIGAYRNAHPNVNITVRKFAYEEYERVLLESWARDEGPDIFSIPNAAVGKYTEFITPMPKTIKLPELVVTGGCSKDIRVVEKSKATLIPEKLDQTFLPVVADDVIVNNQIYALPYAVDVLGLYYNKDLLTASKILAPPQTWQQAVDMVDQTKHTLTKEENGVLVQSGIALGTADNVNRSVDIIAALMMQSGAKMTDPTGKIVTFNTASVADPAFNPGVNALNFYTAFANPNRVTFSWDSTQPQAQEAFSAGKAAMFIGYSYQYGIIQQQNPLLHFGVTGLPQITVGGPQTNIANYWVSTVAKKSKHPNEAWDFLVFSTAEQNIKSYLTKTKRLTALRSLIAQQKDDLVLGPFVDQLLVAKSWYHGIDYLVMEDDMKEMIRSVNAGTKPEEAMNLAVQKIQQTYGR
ncbi:MAG: extracellular solute-binding protein [Candidatus Kerfeldbacteria bacterium]|nr:extracellular solute-binding protein [Candidatus Kerfeldbacteria bacterium]